MAFKLPALPYPLDALEPTMSRETLEYHHGKHHQSYVDKLNKLVAGTELEERSLEELILNCKVGDIFNNAAQVWNHTFFWNCLSPSGGDEPDGKLGDVIGRQFGSFDNFQGQFSEAAAKLFGSGWVWLVRLGNGALSIESTPDGDNPLTEGHTPLLALDVWEHAYYIDYRNERPAFIKAFWTIVNWEFVASRFEAAGKVSAARATRVKAEGKGVGSSAPQG